MPNEPFRELVVVLCLNRTVGSTAVGQLALLHHTSCHHDVPEPQFILGRFSILCR